MLKHSVFLESAQGRFEALMTWIANSREQRLLTPLLSLAVRIYTRSKLFQPHPSLLLHFLVDSRTIRHSLQSIVFSECTF